MLRLDRRILACITALLLAAHAGAQVFIWSGTGNWSSAANWSTNSVPGASDTAQIPSGTVTVNDTRSVGTLTLSGGTIVGSSPGSLTIGAFTHTSGSLSLVSVALTGSSDWSGGDWNGSSATTTVASTSTLTISSGNNHDFNSRTITNNGSVQWTGGQLRSGNGGAIVNNATWSDSASSVFNNDYGGAVSTFTNSLGASYSKNGSGTTRFDIPFTNSGSVSATVGTFQLNGGGASTGSFNTGESGFVLFSNSYSLGDGSSLLGGGGYQVSGGTFTVSGSVTVANFQFSGGTLAGTHTFSGGLTWNGGDLNSSGTTTIGSSGTLNIAGNFNHDFNARSIVNNGTFNWQSGAGQLRSGNGGSFTNNGTFNDAASSVMNNDYGGAVLVFTNSTSGTYNKTATGTTRFDAPFNNNGTVNVSAGTLQLNGGGTNSSTGVLNAAAGASVVFSNDYTLANASSLTGAGSFSLTGGTLNINGTASVSSFAISGGTLAGTHTLSGSLVWNGGNLNSGGTTTIASGATFGVSGNFNHDFNTRTIVNNGTVNWQSGAGQLRSGNGGSFTNNGTFNDVASNVMNNDYGGAVLVFTNSTSGTYNKTATGTTRFDVPFSNNGTVNVSAGTFQLNGGGTNSSTGVLNASAGASVVFSNDYTLANASALTGAGAFALTGGTLTATGSASVSSFAISGGVLAGTHTLNGAIVWNGGNLNSSGTTTVGAGSTFTFSGNFNHDFNVRALVNNGTMTWASDSGQLRSGNGGSITNNGTFNDASSSTINNDYGGTVATFANASTGTYNKTTGSSTYAIPFNNSGAVNVSSGATLQLNGGGTNSASGTITAASGASVIFNNDYTLANASSLGGAGAFSVGGGTLSATGNVNVGNFTFNGGTLAGTQTFTGGLIWAGGTFNSGGTTTIAANSSFTINTGNNHDFNARAIVNNGTTTWNAGQLRSGNGGLFTNNGLFVDAASSSINNDYGGSVLVFTNSTGATYRKTGAGQTNMTVPFTNSGTVDIQNGILGLYSTSTFNDGASTIGTGLLQLISGTFDASGTISFTNFELVGGTVTGTNTLGGHITWTNGNFNSGGTTTLTGTVDIASGNNHDFNARAFVNNGTVNWSAGQLRSGNSGSFTNNSTFNDTASVNFNNDYGGSIAQFANAANGIYNKNAAGTTLFNNVSFANSGTVNTNLGTLALGGGGSSSAGAHFNTASGAALQFTAGSFTIADGLSFAGAGTFAIAGGTVTLGTTISVPDFQLTAGTLAGTQTFTGGLLWTNGNMNAGGTTTIGAGGTFTISTGNNHDFNSHLLVNNGTVNWNGGQLRAGNGSTLTNNGIFNDAASSVINNDYGGSALTFTNSAGASYRKNGGTTSTITVPFINNGEVNTSVGTLVLTAGGTIGNGASFIGAGSTQLTGGTFTASGTIQSTNLLLAGAQLAGTQTFTGILGWDTGNFNTGGTTTIANTGAFTITSGNNHDFNSHAFVNNGTVQWTAGQLRSGNGGSIVNNGTWNDTASSNINNDYGGSAATFANSGTYAKTAAGTTLVDIPFTNSGTVSVTNGTLNFRNSFTNSNGSILLANNSIAQFPGAITLGTGTLAGSGTVSASSVTAGGVVSPGNSAGTLAITGSLSLLSTSSLLIELGGISAGSGYDFLSISGTGTLGGSLVLRFINGYQTTVQANDSFSVVTAATLSGAFTNVANGQRIFTADGFGSFQVNYGTGSAFSANSVVLSNFVPVPEPATWGLLLLGTGLFFCVSRRRR